MGDRLVVEPERERSRGRAGRTGGERDPRRDGVPREEAARRVERRDGEVGARGAADDDRAGAAREGVERVWRMGWPFWAKRKLRGLRLEATDVDWAVGEGPAVRGQAQALLLLLTGRSAAALPALDGPGVARLIPPGAC